MSFPLLLGVWLLAAPEAPEAAQDNLPIDLRWEAPAECPGQGEVEAELARIARVRPGLAPARLNATVEIKKVKDELRLELRTDRDGRRGARELRGRDCRALMRGATLVLALAFGPGVELLSFDEPAPKVPGLSPARRTRTSSPSAARVSSVVFEEAAPEADTRGSIGVDGRLGFGWLPGPALGIGLLAQIAGEMWGLGLLATVWFPHREVVDPVLEARFVATTASALVCAHPWQAIVRLNICGGLSAGLIYGSAQGSDRDQSQLAPWYGAQAHLDLSLAWEAPLSPYLSADLSVGAYRPRFQIIGAGDVHESPRAIPAVGLGVMLEL
ncbi:MAG: hypothetical protein IPG45_31375 [Deltaproteobacteria bacterium]|nr:hypothetical protein [Deltaproteobacteria bacterium]